MDFEDSQIIEKVRKQTIQYLESMGYSKDSMGFIHMVDAMMESILKEKGIDYTTTAQRHPNVIID